MSIQNVLTLIGVALFMTLIWGLMIWFIITSSGAIREERQRQREERRRKAILANMKPGGVFCRDKANTRKWSELRIIRVIESLNSQEGEPWVRCYDPTNPTRDYYFSYRELIENGWKPCKN